MTDHLVCGLSNKNIQKQLFAKKELKLSDTIETVAVIEIAENDAANMKTITPVVNKISHSMSGYSKKKHQSKNDFLAT